MYYQFFTVFFMIWKRGRGRRVHERPHQNAQGCSVGNLDPV
jgi:hypothetical protein